MLNPIEYVPTNLFSPKFYKSKVSNLISKLSNSTAFIHIFGNVKLWLKTQFDEENLVVVTWGAEPDTVTLTKGSQLPVPSPVARFLASMIVTWTKYSYLTEAFDFILARF